MTTRDREHALREQIPDACVTRTEARASGTVAVRAASRPSRRSAALSSIAPPSELAWG